ncbi:MAG TPA: hypothetical protein VKU41_04800 [Polyangiaceae bacterium]|nr:hypothetical protein [Polyangiaceae bacterium]
MKSEEQKYAREVHYEVLSGIAAIHEGKRHMLAIVVYHFTSERDARTFARGHRRKLFRVDRQRRTELKVRHVEAK